jgi:hypothetical protein
MRAVCVGVGPASLATTSAITTSTLSTATPAAPTQTGIVAGCQRYHTIASGEDCSTLESKFDVTLAQLYEWNPSSMCSVCIVPLPNLTRLSNPHPIIK